MFLWRWCRRKMFIVTSLSFHVEKVFSFFLAIPNGFCRLRVHGEKNHTVIAVGNLPARQVLLVVVNNVCTYVWWCLKVWCSYLSSNIYSRLSNMCVHCSILCTDKRFIECVRLLAAQQQCRFFATPVRIFTFFYLFDFSMYKKVKIRNKSRWDSFP